MTDKTYMIQRVAEGTFDNVKAMAGIPDVWQQIAPALIDQYLWAENGYTPRAEARMAYSNKGLHLYMIAWEDEITVLTEEDNGPVWDDSCLEIFLNPFSQISDQYLNIEINAVGTVLLGLGDCRYFRTAPPIPADMNVSSSIQKGEQNSYKGPCWAITYTIPNSLLMELYGKTLQGGETMLGNFQKCGEIVKYPHFGTWNGIRIVNPDFHRPEFFGRMVLAKA